MSDCKAKKLGCLTVCESCGLAWDPSVVAQTCGQLPLPGLAGRVYLNILSSNAYPEQERAYQCARLTDLLWLLVPVIGVIPFLVVIHRRWERITGGES